MRYFLSLALLLACARAFAEDDERLRQLVAQLSAEDVPARNAAQSELERLGAADDTGTVERVLNDAVKSSDPEVSSRARAALRSVRSWEHAVVFGGKTAQAFDLPSGERWWKREGDFPPLKPPAQDFACCTAWVPRRERGACAILQWSMQGIETVDLRTGECRWKIAGCGSGLPMGDGRYLGADDKHLLWISIPDGAILWKRELPALRLRGLHRRCVAYDGETLVVGTEAGAIGVLAATGADRWAIAEKELMLFEAGRGQLFASVRHDDGPTVVQRLDSSTGKPLWQYDIPAGSKASVDVDPAGVARALIVSVYRKDDNTGTLQAHDVETGKVLWEGGRSAYGVAFEPGGEVVWIGGPVGNACNQDHYTDGSLRAVKVATGEVLVQHPTASTATEFLTVGDRLYALDYPPGGFGFHSYVTHAGSGLELFAFDLKSRALLWCATPEGVGSKFSELYDAIRLSGAGGVLLLEGDTGFQGAFAESIDPATGRTVARQVVPAK